MKLVWFRRDLRVIDHTALTAALEADDSVCAIYIATPEQWRQHHMAPIQADLIFRMLPSLCQSLAALNVPLLYFEVDTYADCAALLNRVIELGNIDEVFCHQEYEFNEQQRDHLVEQILNKKHVRFHRLHDRCVMEPGQVINQQGDHYRVFTPFKRTWLARLTAPVISSLKGQSAFRLSPALEDCLFTTESEWHYPRRSSEQWPVSFNSIRQCLRDYCRNTVSSYHLTRDFPAHSSTSRLSPYLAIGALSPRQCLARLYTNAAARGFNDGEMMWINELIWREFYQHLLWFRSDLSKGRCFHDWGERLTWHADTERFERWCQGMTGFPLVDAAMRQLNQTGWMHNRLRMVVASFLVKDLHIDWHWGEIYFMSQLIDGDYAANNGGWQWCASTGCDGQPYFRIFNPVSQSQKFDPDGRFIRQWLPELECVPDRWIHEPWKWSDTNGLSYPKPIVDHKIERTLTLSWYKQAKDS